MLGVVAYGTPALPVNDFGAGLGYTPTLPPDYGMTIPVVQGTDIQQVLSTAFIPKPAPPSIQTLPPMETVGHAVPWGPILLGVGALVLLSRRG